jgi:hypothetical protein
MHRQKRPTGLLPRLSYTVYDRCQQEEVAIGR